jgi:hypothetical protein
VSLFHVIFYLNGVLMATCFKTIQNGGFWPDIEDFPFHFVPLFWGPN